MEAVINKLRPAAFIYIFLENNNLKASHGMTVINSNMLNKTYAKRRSKANFYTFFAKISILLFTLRSLNGETQDQYLLFACFVFSEQRNFANEF